MDGVNPDNYMIPDHCTKMASESFFFTLLDPSLYED
tara:strand:+ start:1903 stop:2010 length:108 start_codon:yes stop_codon:yes gene_type:complete